VLLNEAVGGSGTAFAELYDRYEKQVFNFCLRLVDSREDAADATQEAFLSVLRRLENGEGPVLSFAAYLFATARHESYRVSRRRAGSYSFREAPDGGELTAATDLDSDPERSALLASSQEEVRAANSRLPRRHREVLALRELRGASYEEIAQVMDIKSNAVAQLVFRARSSLRHELRAGAVASIAATSEACERAEALICMRDDGELHDEVDRHWLDRHLDECGACRTRKLALFEIGTTYHGWLPVAAAVGIREHVLERAGELVGADWSSVARAGSHARARPGLPRSPGVAAGVAGALVVAGLALALVPMLHGGHKLASAARGLAGATPAAAAAVPSRAETAASASEPGGAGGTAGAPDQSGPVGAATLGVVSGSPTLVLPPAGPEAQVPGPPASSRPAPDSQHALPLPPKLLGAQPPPPPTATPSPGEAPVRVEVPATANPVPPETVPVETVPVETVPVDTKPVETVPVETKPVETVPVDTKPVDTKPVDTKPVDTKPVDTKPVDTLPTDDDSDDRPGGGYRPH
jgi:RNA polymerase sigma factor (sigma-70 family)